MNDDLTWRFDVAVIEWLIVLAILIILAVVDAVAKRRGYYKAFRKPNSQSDTLAPTSESWHTESAKAVLASFVTPQMLYPEKRQLTDLPNTSRIAFPKSLGGCHCDPWCGTYQCSDRIREGRQGRKNALQAIRQMPSTNAMIMRDGRQITIQAEELVHSDIVLLQSGDKVPADLRLFRVNGLQVQEVSH